MPSPALRQASDIALGPSPIARAALASNLLASLDDPADADADDAWEPEVMRRLEDLKPGKAKRVEAEEALQSLDARLSQSLTPRVRLLDEALPILSVTVDFRIARRPTLT